MDSAASPMGIFLVRERCGNAPYVGVGCPAGLTSWDMSDKMLDGAQVVIPPAPALVPRAKVIPESRPSTRARMWRKCAAG